jgi:hypothetical protein
LAPDRLWVTSDICHGAKSTHNTPQPLHKLSRLQAAGNWLLYKRFPSYPGFQATLLVVITL